MTDIHIDDFYKDVSRIFLHMYMFFPQPCQLYVEDISGPDDTDEYGLHSKRHQACFSTMIWLANEGYISYIDTIKQEALDQAVLTQKAFTLLSTRSGLADKHPKVNEENPPAIVDEFSSNIHQIRLALKTKSSYQIRDIVRHLLDESHKH